MMLRTRHLPLSAAVLAAALAVAGGCKSVNTVERENPTYEANVIKDKRIETDNFLSDKAKVLQVRQATVQDNLLKVDVEILNDKAWAGNFDYKFEWFDEQGMPVDSLTSTWFTKHVEPRETVSIDEIAPNPRCKDFRLKLQRSIRE